MSNSPQKILVIRFSAMGDVALCAPVVAAILAQNPTVEITFLTRPFFEPIFEKNERLRFHFADFKGAHKGFFGVRKLYKELKKKKFDAVVDLHDVLRTKIILNSFRFSFANLKLAKIDKGRHEKEAIVKKQIPLKKLKHTTERYLETFSKIGLNATLDQPFVLQTTTTNQTLLDLTANPFIVIAPFAAHHSKEWGEGKWQSFFTTYYQSPVAQKQTILLLGGGQAESQKLEEWVKLYPASINCTGKYTLAEELYLLSKAAFVIAMDSGNMHLSSLVGTKVISIWGPTHPYLGFSPLYNEALCIQADLACRPCSVYGKLNTKEQEACAVASMEAISVDQVLKAIS